MKFKIIIILLFTICFAQMNGQEEKKTIAIAPFIGAYNQSILSSIEEVVTSSFAKTKRFTLVGRSQMSAIKSERELQKSEDFIDSKFIAQTKNLGAQLLISGNVTSVTASQEQTTNSKGQTSYQYNSIISLDLKMIDVETGQVVASDIISSKANKGLFDMKSLGNMLVGSDPKNEQEAYAFALKRFEKEIDIFVSKNFPASFLIVEIQEASTSSAKKILISGGSSYGLSKGDKLSVVELLEVDVAGKKITRRKEIGEIKISKVEDDNFSICDVKSGGEDILSKFKSKVKLEIITKE